MSWKKNSVKSIRHIRLRHCFSIDVGLRLHGVPRPSSSTRHCSVQPPPSVAMLFLVGPSSFSPQASTRVPQHTHSFPFFFRIWLIQFQLLRLTSQLVFSASAISRTVLLRIYCCHLIFRIPRRYLVLKVSILFSSVLVSF